VTESSPVAGPRPDRTRGRLMDAKRVVKLFFTDTEGHRAVTSRWVNENMPHRIKLSHSRIAWQEKDVEEIIAMSQRKGIPINEVRLAHLETDVVDENT
jgi:hypothetical protein